MAIFGGMKERISQAGQTTVQKAKDLSEITRLNSEISAAENQINTLYGRIGYEIYRAYRDDPQPETADLVQQVTELHQKIEDCKEQIKAINAANTCPQCGAKISKGMAFCSNCGCKLPTGPQPRPEELATCDSCGAPIMPGSAFCTSCGKKLS